MWSVLCVCVCVCCARDATERIKLGKFKFKSMVFHIFSVYCGFTENHLLSVDTRKNLDSTAKYHCLDSFYYISSEVTAFITIHIFENQLYSSMLRTFVHTARNRNYHTNRSRVNYKYTFTLKKSHPVREF